jgi:hypothetical protein
MVLIIESIGRESYGKSWFNGVTVYMRILLVNRVTQYKSTFKENKFVYLIRLSLSVRPHDLPFISFSRFLKKKISLIVSEYIVYLALGTVHLYARGVSGSVRSQLSHSQHPQSYQPTMIFIRPSLLLILVMVGTAVASIYDCTEMEAQLYMEDKLGR